MFLLEIARIAGVSASTVSRVINDCQGVASATAEAVQRAIKESNLTPRSYRRKNRSNRLKTKHVALILFDSARGNAPAFNRLVKGASLAAIANGVHFSVVFWDSDAGIPKQVMDDDFDGVLLHGGHPGPKMRARLTNIPTVWLMAGHLRPPWGDQVLPNDFSVGELAASHLLDGGHQYMAYLGPRSQPWASDLRGLAFCALVESRGYTVHRLLGSDVFFDQLLKECVIQFTRRILREMTSLRPNPTCLFIADDRLLPILAEQLASAGISVGRGKDLDIVSCNSETVYISLISSQLSSIDIRAETIGFQGMEHLCWRMRTPRATEPLRVFVEPRLTNVAECD